MHPVFKEFGSIVKWREFIIMLSALISIFYLPIRYCSLIETFYTFSRLRTFHTPHSAPCIFHRTYEILSVRRSDTASRGTVFLVFCLRKRSFPRSEALAVFLRKKKKLNTVVVFLLKDKTCSFRKKGEPFYYKLMTSTNR